MRFKLLEKFSTPEELLSFMSKNFTYNESDDFSYSWEDMLVTKTGNCYDQTYFELHFLKDMGLKCGGLLYCGVH